MEPRDKQFIFGPFHLDPANRRLLRNQEPTPLAPKAFDTLVYLVENSLRLVSREELRARIWPDSVVEDANLTVNVSLLRKALGSRSDGEPYIETVPRKGYRFNAEVKLIDGADGKVPPESAAELQARQALSPEIAAVVLPRPQKKRLRLQRGLAYAGGAIVLLGLAAGWLFWHPLQRPLQFRQLRLTSFAPERAVTATAISNGAKFIAYANSAGLFVQVIATGETHSLDLPASDVEISSISWFPDSARLLVDGTAPSEETPSLWIVPIIGTAKPARIGSYPPGFVSRDGSKIALLENGSLRRRILVMRSDGSAQRALVTGAEGETFGGLCWTHDGQHIVFTRFRWNPQLRGNTGSIESYDLVTGRTRTILTGSDFAGDVASLPDGRIVYNKIFGANPSASGGEFVEIGNDIQRRKNVGQPLVIATWDAPATDLSVSNDGSHIVFRDLLVQHSVYTGELEDGGKSLRNVHRFTFGLGREDFPRAWAPDGKALFIDSNRNRNWEIFKRELDQPSGVSFIGDPNDQFAPQVSPDGAWLLYLERPRNWHEPQPVSLMRMPISGGLAQVVLTTSEFSEWGLRFECPERAGMSCVLAQRQGNSVVFRTFDPEKGFGTDAKEFGRHDYDPHQVNWAIAPDGSRLAWIKWDPKEARIHTIALQNGRGESERDVLVPGWSNLHAISWAPDGKGWLVVTQFPASWMLLYVDLQGRARLLLTVPSTFAPDLYPSPSGRYLAFSEQSFGSNVWLLEKASAGR